MHHLPFTRVLDPDVELWDKCKCAFDCMSTTQYYDLGELGEVSILYYITWNELLRYNILGKHGLFIHLINYHHPYNLFKITKWGDNMFITKHDVQVIHMCSIKLQWIHQDYIWSAMSTICVLLEKDRVFDTQYNIQYQKTIIIGQWIN